MNKFTVEYTKDGFTETLVYEGKTFIKRYVRTERGFGGLDISWEDDENITDEMYSVFAFPDECEIMDFLKRGN